MKGAGTALLILSVCLLIGSAFYQPTVSSGYGYETLETYNLGLLQYQLMFWQLGLATLATGGVLYGFGTLLERLEKSGVINPVEITAPVAEEPETYACEWCDQTVVHPNQPCSALDEERLRSYLPDIQSEKCRAAIAAQGIN